ncbi:hypothetical protein AYI70_g4850 [Smittium culicis]|uniref:Uncharacterized protein n=1 Tax=Smittium culicis TaxID=133412 RepID=A0A1R1XXL8_9FUNG|nr:hypothetical protein AYI70_g4850 [Smittium culicis]
MARTVELLARLPSASGGERSNEQRQSLESGRRDSVNDPLRLQAGVVDAAGIIDDERGFCDFRSERQLRADPRGCLIARVAVARHQALHLLVARARNNDRFRTVPVETRFEQQRDIENDELRAFEVLGNDAKN